MIVLFSLLVAIIFLRLYQLKFTYRDFDTLGHLYFTKQLKKHKVGPYGPIPVNVVAAEPISNPFFWNWLLVNVFGFDFLKKYQKYVNSILDILFSFLLFSLIRESGYSNEIALASVLVYLSTPLWATLGNAGPRLRSFTPRLFSEIVVMLYFFVIYFDLGLPSWLVLTATSAFAFMVVSSSKFGLQSILFTSVLCAVIDFSLKPVLPLIGGIVLAILVSRGNLVKLLKYQYNHLSWYLDLVRKGNIPSSKRSSFSGLWSSKRNSIQNVYHILFFGSFRNGILAGVVLIPFLTPLIILGIVYVDEFLQLPVSTPILASIIVYALINHRYFLFLGESERYLNHMAGLLSLCFVILLEHMGISKLLYLLLVFNIVYLMNHIRLMRIKRNRSNSRDLNKEITAWLKPLPQKTIICFPYHTGSYYLILMETNHLMFGSILTDLKSHPIEIRGLQPKYPLLDLSRLDEMSEDFGVNLLILNKRFLLELELIDWRPPTDWKQIHQVTDEIMIFEKKEQTKG